MIRTPDIVKPGRKPGMPSISVYVPARIGSQRLARKALKDFGGKPLVAAILTTLGQSELVSDFALNTESEEIAQVAQDMGVAVYHRSPTLAAAETTTEEILADFARECQTHYVAAINPTNPLLSAATIDAFFTSMIESQYDTAFSVSEYRKHVLMDGAPLNYCPFGPHPRTQDVRPVFMLNWAIVAWRTDLVKRMVRGRGDSIYLGRTGFIPIPEVEAMDIDTQTDFDMTLAMNDLLNHQLSPSYPHPAVISGSKGSIVRGSVIKHQRSRVSAQGIG